MQELAIGGTVELPSVSKGGFHFGKKRPQKGVLTQYHVVRPLSLAWWKMPCPSPTPCSDFSLNSTSPRTMTVCGLQAEHEGTGQDHPKNSS